MTPQQRYRQRNRLRLNEYSRKRQLEWRRENPELYAKKREESAGRRKEYLAKYRLANRERTNEYARVYYKRKVIGRRRWLSEIKSERGCIDCGYRQHPDALHFDHLPLYSKAFNVSQGRMKNKQQILQEMAKCEVRCANCHAIKTAERRRKDAV